MKKIIYILSLIVIGSIYSCSEKKQKYNNEPSNFFFKVPGTDIGITTSKVPGAQFYVVFAKDSVLPSDTVDYIKYETGEMCNIQLIFLTTGWKYYERLNSTLFFLNLASEQNLQF